MKPIEAIESPSVLSPLAPYLSESEPLVGPTRRRVASNGISARPAVYAEYPLTSWKYNVKTKASEENASPLKRLDKLPVVKIRSEERRVGKECRSEGGWDGWRKEV